MAKYEITQAQWRSVMGTAPALHREKGERKPVEMVTWTEAVSFCDRLGLALPTEAQWEYARRGGLAGPFAVEGGPESLPFHAWFEGNSEKDTHAVGRKKPNGFGLYDIIGNVDEWCADAYGEKFYASSAASSPDPICEEGSLKVYRGGSAFGIGHELRAARRFFAEPGFKVDSLGFRPVILVE